MPMTPFFSKFPELAPWETRTVQVRNHPKLPDGNYGFLESYCDEDGCDCRRVILAVCREDDPGTLLATINYGWASVAYYRNWARCSRKEAREYKGASLDPLNPQSEHSPALLALFRAVVLRDDDYVARLTRHYRMMKGKLWTCDAILGEFRKDQDVFAREAVQMAVIRQQEITPLLLGVLEEVTRHPEEAIESNDYAILYALHLLAQFRERKAYPLLIRFLSTAGEHADYLLGDTVTEGLKRILASVYDGDIAPLQALVGCPTANEWVRSAAVKAHTILVLSGLLDRSVMVEFLRGLLHTGFEELPHPVRTAVADEALDIHPGELMDDLRAAYDRNLLDRFCLSVEELENQAALTVEAILEEGRRNPHLALISDAAQEMEWWACFNPNTRNVPAWSSKQWDDDEDQLAIPTPPPVRGYVAGNDFCPCGSGRKYKKCCGAPAGGSDPVARRVLTNLLR